VITHVEQLDDGRYNIVLRGVERFRVVEEDDRRSYRRAVVEPLAERRLDADDRAAVRAQRAKLEALLSPGRSDPSCGSEAPAGPVIAAKAMAAMGDEELVNALAQYLGLDPLERQALLEHGSLRSRAESLVELLEMKIIVARTPGLSGVAH
jgi:hypothetical protein